MVFLLLFLFNLVHSQSTAWKNAVIGGGGFVTGIIYNLYQPDTLYIRTDVGGAYRWEASNESWIPLLDMLNNNEYNNMGVFSLASDALVPQRVLLALGEYTESWAANASLYISFDYGNSWYSKIILPFKLGGNEVGRGDGERLVIDTNYNGVVLLGTNANGLWKSIDFGVSWNHVPNLPELSILFVLFDPLSGSFASPTPGIYVSINSTKPCLYRSLDGGNTWNIIPGSPSGLFALRGILDFVGNLYLTFGDNVGPNGLTKGSVQKLNLKTLQWTDITPSPLGQGGFGGITIHPSNPLTIYVSTLDRWYPQDEIYRSTDGGKTWLPLIERSNWDRTLGPYTSTLVPHWINQIQIDPFHSERVMFVTGYGLWSTTNISVIDENKNITWMFQVRGLEETVPHQLISPPIIENSTNTPVLYSALGLLDGFKHDSLTQSPPQRFTPLAKTNTDISLAWNNISNLVRVHNDLNLNYGAYSRDSGLTWMNFQTFPQNTSGGGTITISNDGHTIIWSPENTSYPSYSINQGTTWIACQGLPSNLRIISDKVNPKKFYTYDALKGLIYYSIDSGVTFNQGYSSLPIISNSNLRSTSAITVPEYEGHLWVTTSQSLYRSINSGLNFTLISNVEGYLVTTGKSSPLSVYPTIFLYGKINNTIGVFRSDDIAVNWIRIDDDVHRYGGLGLLVGDSQVYGRVYASAARGNGRGILYGELLSNKDNVQNLSCSN